MKCRRVHLLSMYINIQNINRIAYFYQWLLTDIGYCHPSHKLQQLANHMKAFIHHLVFTRHHCINCSNCSDNLLSCSVGSIYTECNLMYLTVISLYYGDDIMRDRSWSRGSQLTFTAIMAIGQLLMCMTPDWWLDAGRIESTC